MAKKSRYRDTFKHFNMPLYEFPLITGVRYDKGKECGVTIMGYLDSFGNYFDFTMFTSHFVRETRKKYDSHKMSTMQVPSGSRKDTKSMSSMYQ